MLATFKNAHHGKKIAVLGSGPSVKLFSRKEDAVIGVNGAAKLLEPGDYFLSGDKRAHLRSWFLELRDGIACMLKPHAAMYSARFYPDEKIRAGLIAFYEGYMAQHPEEVHVSDDGFRAIRRGNAVVDCFIENFPLPAQPHAIIRKYDPDQSLSKDMDALINGGSSACEAMQVAFVMGAKSIHLYGVQFNNDAIGDPNSHTGTNYFYVPNKGEEGRTKDSQLQVMDGLIAKAMELGTNVYSYGFTRLQNPVKLMPESA